MKKKVTNNNIADQVTNLPSIQNEARLCPNKCVNFPKVI